MTEKKKKNKVKRSAAPADARVVFFPSSTQTQTAQLNAFRQAYFIHKDLCNTHRPDILTWKGLRWTHDTHTFALWLPGMCNF